MKRTMTALGTIALLGGFAATAHASSVNSLLNQGSQDKLLSDNSAEILVNAAGSPDNTLVEVGDKLRGILAINTIEDLNGAVPDEAVGVGSSNNELTALFEVEVVQAIDLGFDLDGNGKNDFQFIFGPSASFATEVAGLGFSNTAGAAAAFFEDASPDFTRTGTVAAGEASATDGNPFWLFGFDGIDDFWASGTFASNDIADAVSFNLPAAFGTFNIALSLLDNPFGVNLNPIPCQGSMAETCGSGNVVAPAGTTGFDAFDNVDFSVNIPTPATLGLMGLGLLGVGVAARRRRHS